LRTEEISLALERTVFVLEVAMYIHHTAAQAFMAGKLLKQGSLGREFNSCDKLALRSSFTFPDLHRHQLLPYSSEKQPAIGRSFLRIA
jgi:hypothetical protein